jgi:hypothetical protein
MLADSWAGRAGSTTGKCLVLPAPAPFQPLEGRMPWSNSLELYFARQVSAYHKNRHRALQMPPVLAWEGSEIVLAGSNFARLIYRQKRRS